MKSTLSNKLKKILVDFFRQQEIPLFPRQVFAVCFSGGGDSTALLNLINEMACEYLFKVKAVYVRHNMRPFEECDAEESFVRSFCKERKIPLREEVIPEGEIFNKIHNTQCSPEEAARNERYRVFADLHREGWAEWFLTAHHQDDNWETVVQRFFSGAGVGGLKGIPPSKNFILRPLLSVPGNMLKEYLRSENISWMEDSTNTDLSFMRNRYRHVIIPFLKKEIPGFEEGMRRLIRKMEEADKMKQDIPICPILKKADSVRFSRKQWKGLSTAGKTETFFSAFRKLSENQKSGERISYNLIREIICNEGKPKYYRGIRIEWTPEEIILYKSGSDEIRIDFLLDISIPGEYPFPDGSVSVQISENDQIDSDICIPGESLHFPVYLRSVRFGDQWEGKPLSLKKSERGKAVCLADRSGILAVRTPERCLRKEKKADLEKNQFFNYYIKIRTDYGR